MVWIALDETLPIEGHGAGRSPASAFAVLTRKPRGRLQPAPDWRSDV